MICYDEIHRIVPRMQYNKKCDGHALPLVFRIKTYINIFTPRSIDSILFIPIDFGKYQVESFLLAKAQIVLFKCT